MKEKKKELKMAMKEKMTVSEVAAGYGIVGYGPNATKETRETALKWLEAWRKVL